MPECYVIGSAEVSALGHEILEALHALVQVCPNWSHTSASHLNLLRYGDFNIRPVLKV
jgi:hypothetical protein